MTSLVNKIYKERRQNVQNKLNVQTSRDQSFDTGISIVPQSSCNDIPYYDTSLCNTSSSVENSDIDSNKDDDLKDDEPKDLD